MQQLEIRKATKSLGVLVIKPITRERAREMIIAGHYSHKWQANFGKHSFGIFRAGAESEADCLGVAAFGYMKTPKARIFTCDVPGGWMCELNRMWIDDSLGKNAETVLLGASFKLLRRVDPTIVAVQSFADGRVGCGTIYKAANFQYFGFHWSTFFLNEKSGEVYHEQILNNSTCASGFMRSNVALLAGDLQAFRVKTYRYIYPLHPSFRFTGAGKMKPYPPYEKGVEPATRYINPDTLRPRMQRALDALLARWPHISGGGGCLSAKWQALSRRGGAWSLAAA